MVFTQPVKSDSVIMYREENSNTGMWHVQGSASSATSSQTTYFLPIIDLLCRGTFKTSTQRYNAKFSKVAFLVALRNMETYVPMTPLLIHVNGVFDECRPKPPGLYARKL